MSLRVVVPPHPLNHPTGFTVLRDEATPPACSPSAMGRTALAHLQALRDWLPTVCSQCRLPWPAEGTVVDGTIPLLR